MFGIFRVLAWALRRIENKAGTISVEAALIAPILVLGLTATIDLGAAAIHRMQMENALRSGLQYASVRKPLSGDMTGVEDAVKNASPMDYLGTRVVLATYYCECQDQSIAICTDGCASGNTSRYVTIVITENYQLFLGFALILPDIFEMRVEGNIRIN